MWSNKLALSPQGPAIVDFDVDIVSKFYLELNEPLRDARLGTPA